MTFGSGSPIDYSFDASSNLTTLPTGATATYNDASQLTSSALSGTTTSYTYNADGEQLSAKQGSTTITSGTWNGTGELISYSDAAADMTAATYDGNGLRASATTGSGTQNFTWDAAGNLLMDSTNAYLYTHSTAPPTEQVNLATGTITYLVADSLGSVRGTINSSGTLTGTTSYDAWGNPAVSGGLTATTPFGFAGGYTDPDGLVYLINRYYDPPTGQFTSVDPEVAQTLEPYLYASGNPVSNTDPTGCSYCDQTFKHEPARVHFWRTNSGRVGWDFWLMPAAKAAILSDGTDEAVVSLPLAEVNYNNVLSPPYGPHKREINYDFHSSMYKYAIKPHNVGLLLHLKTGDILSLLWSIDASGDDGKFYGWRNVTCIVPSPGSGTPGPYGPYN